MNVELSRRQFMAGAGAGLAVTTLGALGFGETESAYAAAIRPFKLTKLKEARSTCPYCSVSCGMLLFSKQNAETGKLELAHIEGDVDNPINRGTLCPKGAAAMDFVRSETRVLYPMHRKPGAYAFERVNWDFALDRIARLIKQDRDANFIATNAQGVTVNRLTTTGLLGGCAASNETGWLTYKFARSLGLVQVDNQARI